MFRDSLDHTWNFFCNIFFPYIHSKKRETVILKGWVQYFELLYKNAEKVLKGFKTIQNIFHFKNELYLL